MRGSLNHHSAFRIRCWGQRWKTKMQLDAHKSFCRQHTLKLIMSSRLVCLALYSARCWSEACLQHIHRKHAHWNAHRVKSASRKERTECIFKRNSSSSLWHGQQMCGLHCVWQSHMCTPHFHGKVILFSSLQRPQKSAMISSFRKNWFKMGKTESLPSQRILSSLNLENQSRILSVKHLVFYISVYIVLIFNICTYTVCIPILLYFLGVMPLIYFSRSCNGDLMSTRSCSELENKIIRQKMWYYIGKGAGGGETGRGSKRKIKEDEWAPWPFWAAAQDQSEGGAANRDEGRERVWLKGDRWVRLI